MRDPKETALKALPATDTVKGNQTSTAKRDGKGDAHEIITFQACRSCATRTTKGTPKVGVRSHNPTPPKNKGVIGFKTPINRVRQAYPGTPIKSWKKSGVSRRVDFQAPKSSSARSFRNPSQRPIEDRIGQIHSAVPQLFQNRTGGFDTSRLLGSQYQPDGSAPSSVVFLARRDQSSY